MKSNAKTATPKKLQTELREAIYSQHFYQCNVCGGLGCFQRLCRGLMYKDVCPCPPNIRTLFVADWQEVIPKNKRGFHVTKKP